ncbi:hypothetical protein HPB47_024850 [Ixodes persulcatus]|uniref:Uncharacterized protein n=1 Tax=Ixodes persulcatus TaxID=34615 RepID=A0AC60Q337_IXOPE|nr:hypothetical protein HPB47_024850 [Ixodes persulcatus]
MLEELGICASPGEALRWLHATTSFGGKARDGFAWRSGGCSGDGGPRGSRAPWMLSEPQLQPLAPRLRLPAQPPPRRGDGAVHAWALGMKPVLLQAAGAGPGGALAGRASPPALSPNLPSVVKVEPRLPSPCVGSGGDLSGPAATSAFSPSKRLRQDDAGAWISSPSSQMSVGSLSPPPPLLNGAGLSLNSASHSNNNSSGLSPVSCSSYETYSPRGTCKVHRFHSALEGPTGEPVAHARMRRSEPRGTRRRRHAAVTHGRSGRRSSGALYTANHVTVPHPGPPAVARPCHGELRSNLPRARRTFRENFNEVPLF